MPWKVLDLTCLKQNRPKALINNNVSIYYFYIIFQVYLKDWKNFVIAFSTSIIKRLFVGKMLTPTVITNMRVYS